MYQTLKWGVGVAPRSRATLMSSKAPRLCVWHRAIDNSISIPYVGSRTRSLYTALTGVRIVPTKLAHPVIFLFQHPGRVWKQQRLCIHSAPDGVRVQLFLAVVRLLRLELPTWAFTPSRKVLGVRSGIAFSKNNAHSYPILRLWTEMQEAFQH